MNGTRSRRGRGGTAARGQADERAAAAREAADRAAAEEAAEAAAARRPASPARGSRERGRSPERRSARQRSRSRSPGLTREQVLAAIAEGMRQKEKGLNVGSAPKQAELKLCHRLLEHAEKAPTQEDRGEWLIGLL